MYRQVITIKFPMPNTHPSLRHISFYPQNLGIHVTSPDQGLSFPRERAWVRGCFVFTLSCWRCPIDNSISNNRSQFCRGFTAINIFFFFLLAQHGHFFRYVVHFLSSPPRHKGDIYREFTQGYKVCQNVSQLPVWPPC